jgi:hypothetical protein
MKMQNHKRAYAGSSRRLTDQTELATAAILALAPNITKTFGDLVRELKASQSALAAVIVELTIADGSTETESTVASPCRRVAGVGIRARLHFFPTD